MSFLSKVKRIYVLAGEVIPINFGKKPAPVQPAAPAVAPVKKTQPKAGTPEHETSKHVEYAKMHGIPLEHVVDRFGHKVDQFHDKFGKVMKMDHEDPYYGGDPHTRFRGEEEKKEKEVVPFPLPVVVRDLKGILGKGVAQGTGADPFMWMDAKYGATRAALKSHKDKKLEIHTRSDLIAHDDYIALLNSKLHTVFIHLFTENPEVSRALEPGCPSPKRRLNAARKLLDHGIKVVIVLDMLKTDPFIRKGLHNELSQQTKADFKTSENLLDLSVTEQKRLNQLVSENNPKPADHEPAKVVPLRKI